MAYCQNTCSQNTRWAVLLLTIACLASALLSSMALAKTPYEDKLRETAAGIKALERTKRRLEKGYSDTEKTLKRLESTLSKTQRSLRETQADLTVQQKAFDALQADIEKTDVQMQREASALKHQLRAAYQQGVPHPLEFLLSDQQPDTWGQLAIYHQAVITARDDRFKRLRELRALKEDQKARLVLVKKALVEKEAEAKADIERLAALRQEQKKTGEKLRREQATTDSKLARLQNEQQQLAALLEAWKSRQVATQPFAQSKGKLNWPVTGKISLLAERNASSGRKGVFIAAKAGATVKAVHDGQIIFSDWLRGFGMMCIIDHGDGYLSLYGHNDALTRQAGDRVRAGEQIGTVGSSGGQSAPGVYFELRHNGKPTNAKQWLARSEP